MKKIFITGSTSGLGKIIAERCLKMKYEVYATGRNREALDFLSNLGANVIQGDLCSKEDIHRICNELPDIDVAVINAGVGFFENAYDLSDEEIDLMVDVNIRAPIYLARNLAKKMIPRHSGHFIFIGSQAGKVATKKASVYAASKHAITGFANGLRLELAPFNIKVSAVFPGPIDTPFLDKADSTSTYRSSVKGVLLNPQTVAKEVVNLIEHPAREINLPRIMGLTSKLYAVAPGIVEKVGKRFFTIK
ncbi:SDR family NAD(P)-dependent oxidoreductase [Ureibacillus sp. FSL K6-8385]|uniref:SDR family NAD(P)-dependent oxidoreductase n=1 Tax=Ureibacillus terrenus TaxID=118246 RepID=A0A540V613_9BACL|nr:SDR family NAD(P)-dependent oxidoreductase [Ureibacillus terrenus]MED3763020.1 SDR family NAD(P)-dependent oxidoreductase [Ureibacillus terrenus]TQE92182.1 SDR family NAD(P)-dependent oxidoreductase [Ureibacillus terrenus]